VSAIVWAPALLFRRMVTVTAIGHWRLAKELELPISIGIFICGWRSVSRLARISACITEEGNEVAEDVCSAARLRVVIGF